MPIYQAILKYGHANFSLEIIEYTKPQNLIEREQYYLDNYDFEYNLLEKAGSSLGFKHTEKTIEYLKSFKHSVNNKEKMKEIWVERKYKKILSFFIEQNRNLRE